MGHLFPALETSGVRNRQTGGPRREWGLIGALLEAGSQLCTVLEVLLGCSVWSHEAPQGPLMGSGFTALTCVCPRHTTAGTSIFSPCAET